MGVCDSAKRARDYLLDEVEPDLLAVGWYSSDAEQRTGTVYLSGAFSEHDGNGRGALENAMLESIGNPALEQIHGETPTTTVRFYESVVDVDVHLGEFEGIVFALDADGEYRLRKLIDDVKTELPDSVGSDSA